MRFDAADSMLVLAAAVDLPAPLRPLSHRPRLEQVDQQEVVQTGTLNHLTEREREERTEAEKGEEKTENKQVNILQTPLSFYQKKDGNNMSGRKREGEIKTTRNEVRAKGKKAARTTNKMMRIKEKREEKEKRKPRRCGGSIPEEDDQDKAKSKKE